MKFDVVKALKSMVVNVLKPMISWERKQVRSC